MRVNVLGRCWSLRFTQCPNGYLGFTDHPDLPFKEIRIQKGLEDDEEEMRTIVHELLHAADWYKDEEWVEDVSHAVARALTRCGYRRTAPRK